VGGDEKMGVFVAGVPSSLAPRTPFFSRSPSPSPFTPATQAIFWNLKAIALSVSVCVKLYSADSQSVSQ